MNYDTVTQRLRLQAKETKRLQQAGQLIADIARIAPRDSTLHDCAVKGAAACKQLLDLGPVIALTEAVEVKA